MNNSADRGGCDVIFFSLQRAKKVVSDSLVVSGFCYWASDFCSQLARRASAVFWGNSSHRRIVINPANQKGFGG